MLYRDKVSSIVVKRLRDVALSILSVTFDVVKGKGLEDEVGFVNAIRRCYSDFVILSKKYTIV